MLDHSLNVVKPAIKWKAQLSSSSTELLFLCLSKTLCPYCRVTRNVIVDISKEKESSLEECRELCSCLFLYVFFLISLTSILMLVLSLHIVSPGHRFCSGKSYWAQSSQKDGDQVECAKFKTINTTLTPDGFLVSFIVLYFLLLSSAWGGNSTNWDGTSYGTL